MLLLLLVLDAALFFFWVIRPEAEVRKVRASVLASEAEEESRMMEQESLRRLEEASQEALERESRSREESVRASVRASIEESLAEVSAAEVSAAVVSSALVSAAVVSADASVTPLPESAFSSVSPSSAARPEVSISGGTAPSRSRMTSVSSMVSVRTPSFTVPSSVSASPSA